MKNASSFHICALGAVAAAAMAACSGGSGLAPAGITPGTRDTGLTALSKMRDAALTMPHFRSFPVHTDHGKSFMRPDAKGSALLYVGDWSTNDVYVYDYPSGTAVGTITGNDEPYGMCTDSSGDVYVANYGSGTVNEYALGSTTVKNTYDPGGEPIGCSVSSTGLVAVTSFDPGELVVYQKGKTTGGATYSDSSCEYEWTAGYDTKGDLIGVGEYSSVDVCALMNGSKSETTLTESGITIDFPAGSHYDGKYFTLGDQEAGGAYQTGVWETTLSGTTITAAASEIKFSDSCYSDYTDDVNPFFVGSGNIEPDKKSKGGQAAAMVGPNLWCVDEGPAKVDYWPYPAGGTPTGSLTSPPAEPYGAAVVFNGSSGGAKGKVILSFAGGAEGATPNTTLITDSSGNLYGTTESGGTGNDGTVFELVRSGKKYTQEVLHSFGGTDGADPQGALLLATGGVIYGTTAQGGDASCQCGVIFSLTPGSGGYTYSTLYKFAGSSDGANPMAGLTAGSSGTMYGTTEYGGNSSCATNGCGTIFQYDPKLGYAQDAQLDSSVGIFPVAPLTLIACGSSCGSTALAGVATQGGSSGSCTGGCGTIFEADKVGSTWTVNVAYSFGSQSGDGSDPESPVTQVGESPPAFVGATKSGGASCNCGTVYYASRPASGSWPETVLHQFASGTGDGQSPAGGLVIDSSGAVLGATNAGGKKGAGAAFVVTYTGSGSSPIESVIYNYDKATGSAPLAGFAIAGSGTTDRLFGTAGSGGKHGHGTGLIITHEQGGGHQAHSPRR
ncbi:MAG TPA: choice-of-anchor tandem repeat GloVer-containing protein [Candidatus Cybelea sp.]|nr:choice-of-anchor tandem repeat GloVer-containing protein [Candidatus Cybelea sp.]